MTDFEQQIANEKEPSHENSKARILKMIEDSPHDFDNFDINQLTSEDFELEERYHNTSITDNELRARQANMDIDHPLNESQKELNIYLINQIMARLTA